MEKEKSGAFQPLDYLQNCPEELREQAVQYLNQLNDKEKKACIIAKDHLGSSFNIMKSVGYLEWKSKNCS